MPIAWKAYSTVPVKALEPTFAFIMQRDLKAAKDEYQFSLQSDKIFPFKTMQT